LGVEDLKLGHERTLAARTSDREVSRTHSVTSLTDLSKTTAALRQTARAVTVVRWSLVALVARVLARGHACHDHTAGVSPWLHRDLDGASCAT
jgi:hypothetical protein